MKIFWRYGENWQRQNPRCDMFSDNGTAVPARANSPSILEGVPVGRGSNIDIEKSPCEILEGGTSWRGSNIKNCSRRNSLRSCH